MNIIGEVKDMEAVILDDMIDTGGTLTEAAKVLMEKGAKAVYACCTHPVLSGPAVDRILESPLNVWSSPIPFPCRTMPNRWKKSCNCQWRRFSVRLLPASIKKTPSVRLFDIQF